MSLFQQQRHKNFENEAAILNLSYDIQKILPIVLLEIG